MYTQILCLFMVQKIFKKRSLVGGLLVCTIGQSAEKLCHDKHTFHLLCSQIIIESLIIPHPLSSQAMQDFVHKCSKQIIFQSQEVKGQVRVLCQKILASFVLKDEKTYLSVSEHFVSEKFCKPLFSLCFSLIPI